MSPRDHHDDFAFEPVPGLPKRLPPEEKILWRGAPAWRRLARRAFHIRKIAAYFAILFVWQVGARIFEGGGLAEVTASASWILGLSATGLGIIALIAYVMARSTIYTLTNKRIIIRTGVALPVTINIPLKLIRSADLKMNADGSGDIAMTADPKQRVYYTLLWPNVRPWRLAKPEPMLRCLDKVEPVAELLSEALRKEALLAEAEENGADETIAAKPQGHGASKPQREEMALGGRYGAAAG